MNIEPANESRSWLSQLRDSVREGLDNLKLDILRMARTDLAGLILITSASVGGVLCAIIAAVLLARVALTST